MDYRILGPLEVVDGDRTLTLGGPSSARCSRCSCCARTRSSPPRRLIDRLWDERPPSTAAKVVQVQVWRLRRALGPEALVTRPPGYLLQVGADEFDLARFEQLVGDARGAAPPCGRRKSGEALALWRGPPLADLAHEPFAQAEVGAPGGAPAGRARAAHRGRPGARPARGARPRARGARRRASAARAAARPADARAVPVGPAGRRARGASRRFGGCSTKSSGWSRASSRSSSRRRSSRTTLRSTCRHGRSRSSGDDCSSRSTDPRRSSRCSRSLGRWCNRAGRELVIALVVEAGDLCRDRSAGRAQLRGSRRGVAARAAAFRRTRLDRTSRAWHRGTKPTRRLALAPPLDGETALLETAPCDVALVGAGDGAPRRGRSSSLRRGRARLGRARAGAPGSPARPGSRSG